MVRAAAGRRNRFRAAPAPEGIRLGGVERGPGIGQLGSAVGCCDCDRWFRSPIWVAGHWSALETGIRSRQTATCECLFAETLVLDCLQIIPVNQEHAGNTSDDKLARPYLRVHMPSRGLGPVAKACGSNMHGILNQQPQQTFRSGALRDTMRHDYQFGESGRSGLD